MVNRMRMKKDLAGQAVIIAALAAAGLCRFPGWVPVALAVALGLWQGASALQLVLAYDYQERYPFLCFFLGMVLALPPGIWWIGDWLVVPAALGLAAYFAVTARDTLYVLQRPRSFWDL
ncbi:MAG: hypothetical protein J5I98_08265, partial [Phaeodactylibacter sp.]|nr:hypothetical protein [Phaeodactylibacter sp.]